MAKERRGANLVVTKTVGHQIAGELIAVKPSSLLLLDSQTGADVSVEIAEIAVIKTIKISKFWQRAVWGLVIGGTVGALYGASSYHKQPEISEAQGAVGYAAIGAASGVAIAGTFSAIKDQDETIQVEGKSDTEIKSLLEKLRRQARVPDAQ